MPIPARHSLRLVLALGVTALAGAMVAAQIEGEARGVAPIDSSGSFEVSGIAVDVSAATADAARIGGWREAQRRGWRVLSQRLGGGGGSLPDSTLDSIVAGIVVESEQIGPTRYIARLGVLFDRARAGQLLGVGGRSLRSPPLLVIPIQYSGGTAQVFEQRTEWQRAWARFRTGNSAIDYVRPSGTGADPLLLNVAQTGRPGRRWWRTLLDQYGAADVVIPVVRLHRQWPGGPVIGVFSARYGPDNRLLGELTLRVENSAALPALLDAGIKRLDEVYEGALRAGRLRPDPSLTFEEPVDPDAPPEEGIEIPVETVDTPSAGEGSGTSTLSLQFDTPNVGAVSATENSVGSVPGVRSATTISLALGGTSVMRVAFDGDVAALRLALEARGWQVSEFGGGLRLRRAAPAPTSPPPETPPPENVADE